MTEVGLFEAKTHLSRLVERVERGEEITLTRNGKPVARLTAVEPPRRSREEIERLMREFKEAAKGNRLDGLTTKELINEGRRYLDDGT